MHKWGNQGTERLSSPPMSPQKRKKEKRNKKTTTSTSIRPQLSEKGSLVLLPSQVTHSKALAHLGLGNHTRGLPPSLTLPALPPAKSQSHFTLWVGCVPQSTLLRTCSISGKKIYVLYVVIFPRAPVFFSF